MFEYSYGNYGFDFSEEIKQIKVGGIGQNKNLSPKLDRKFRNAVMHVHRTFVHKCTFRVF